MSRYPLRLLAPLAGVLLLSTTAHGQDHGSHQHDHDAHAQDCGQEKADSDTAVWGMSAALTVEGLYHNCFSGDEDSQAGFDNRVSRDGGQDDAHDEGHDEHSAGHDHGFDDGFNLGHSEVLLRGETSLFEGQLADHAH